MEEHTRVHERITDYPLAGRTIVIHNVLANPVSVFVPEVVATADSFNILIHFHGSAFIASTAVARLERPMVAVNVHLGSGSSVYERPFLDGRRFDALVETVTDSLSTLDLVRETEPPIYLSAFSAGYGAVRAILRTSADRVAGILLLDGLHTDYVPDRKVLSEGGRLEESKLAPFVEFARMAVEGEKRLVITHSEIFPWTFASTTETSDFIITSLGLKRTPVLEWGPGGMQLLSRTEAGRLTVLGFAGNTAPDHVDHLHGMPEFLTALMDS
ncbi:MAG TPA: hypothetical protein VMO47_16510 [Rhodothermales bacterium]|nr:hypothetical protein [Rhodothermales bacterium]